jgi:HEPN domain-containing protein
LSRPELEEAYLLLRKACEDADAVRKLSVDADMADAVVGFHAQQTAEKAMKAVLASLGDDFPWTHDLRHLIERLDAVGAPLPATLHDVRVLGPWAVEFRYGETIDDPLDREQAVALVAEVVAWARAHIEAPAHTQTITRGDREAGIIRVPSHSKGSFPAERSSIGLVLRGADLGAVRWDPRFGPDRERSGVLRIGKEAAAALTEGEALRITSTASGVRLD